MILLHHHTDIPLIRIVAWRYLQERLFQPYKLQLLDEQLQLTRAITAILCQLCNCLLLQQEIPSTLQLLPNLKIPILSTLVHNLVGRDGAQIMTLQQLARCLLMGNHMLDKFLINLETLSIDGYANYTSYLVICMVG